MGFGNTKRKTITAKKSFAFAVKMLLIMAACLGMACVTVNAVTADERRLLNGSFEESQTWTGSYLQLDQSAVPSWNTTAFQGKIELFRSNKGTYFKDITLTPSDGSYAAELNADEESTLYQIVKTAPSSVYEWGLDHGARNGVDTMALVIGPNQSVAPSKTSKEGRDQFMQMIDWLIAQGKTSFKTSAGLGEHIVVYSKKFGTNGTFEDNAGNNAFSLTPSTIYTEEWHIWIMASAKGASNSINPWYSYGANADTNEEAVVVNALAEDNLLALDNVSIDLSKYYYYSVPAGQTETLFGFVSVGWIDSSTTSDKAKTYGNFVDNINFEVYHPLSGSTTIHGSAIIGGSDGTTEGEGSTEGHKLTANDNFTTYIINGESLKIQAIVNKDDADSGCEFVGVYYTSQDSEGNAVTEFFRLAGNMVEDSGSLTDEEKKGKWVKSINEDGDIVYTYYFENVSSPADVHFVFIKNPTITYDSNGGKDYIVERAYNTSEATNVYSFRPATGVENATAETGTVFIPPYVSKAAEGKNDGWKFMGWLLTGDTIENIPDNTKQINADQLGSMILPAVHTVSCDYSIDNAMDASYAQYFNIYNGNVALTESIYNDDIGSVAGVHWTDKGETKSYANFHKGLTMMAQWRWRQAFIPQLKKDGVCTDSSVGGTVKVTSVKDEADENYVAEYNTKGGKAYYATTDETITVTACEKEGYTFEGWYDESGNLVTTNLAYSYPETKGTVNTYYARFSDSITQTYIRQVKNGNVWENTEDDSVGTLGRYSYTDVAGTQISSTAAAGTNYKFIGWYDSDGNKVADDMLINGGMTISYTTTVNATYYARFERSYRVRFIAQTMQTDGTFKNDNVGGSVSVSSVADVNGATVSSAATANSGSNFLGWYDASGNQLSTNAVYSVVTSSSTNGSIYYARFEIVYNITVDSKTYLSFVAESEEVQIPSVFDGRDAGTGKNTSKYGLQNRFGNTIATGFKYSIDNMTNVSTIQITITVPDTAYVKVGGTGSFTGNGTSILIDSGDVAYNRGSIQRISGETTLTYYWDATGLSANTTYGFIIDNLYAPNAVATITVNGTTGTEITNDNGVVNTAASEYKSKTNYLK